MTTFRYRALTPNGEVASGSISAPTAAEVSQRVEYLGLIPIETVRDEGGTGGARWDFTILSRPRPEDVTVFTGDLAPLLQTGARINDALELLSADADIGRLRPTAAKLTAAILSGESFADALARHPALFPPMYVELARVGEASARWSIYWRCSAPNGPAPRRCAGASPMPAQPAIGDDPFERQRAHGAIAEGRHLSCDPRRSMRRTCQRGGSPVPSVWDVLRRHDFPRAARRGLRSPHRLAKRGNRGCSSQSSLSASPPRRI